MEQRSNKITLKASLEEDIRRITIDDSVGFKDLKKILKKLFKPSYRFHMGYIDDEGDFINIRSDLDMQAAVKHARKNVLRIKIEAPDNMRKTTEVPAELEAESKNELIPLLGRKDEAQNFRDEGKLREMIMETVMSQTVLDALTQRLLPQLVAAVREEVSKKEDASTNNTFDYSFLMDSIPKALNEQVPKILHVPYTTSDIPSIEDASSEEESEDEEEEEEEEERDMRVFDQTPMQTSVLSTESLPEEPAQEEEERQESEPKKEEEEEEEEEGENLADPESFVVVQNTKDMQQQRKPSLSGLKMLLSVFSKIARNKNKESDDEKEDAKGEDDKGEPEVTTLDEALAQLVEMGFADLEGNVKLLRFHKRYNEGVDAVIEDLLLQYQEKQKEQQQAAAVAVEPAKN